MVKPKKEEPVVVPMREFVDTFRAVGRGERPPPAWAGKTVYASDSAIRFNIKRTKR